MKQGELVNRTIFFSFFLSEEKLGTTQKKSSCINVHINDKKRFLFLAFFVQ